MGNLKTVGRSYPRHESVQKVTGRARYTDDLEIPGMVYGRILRSPYAHARVLHIDKTEAERVWGVLGILLPSDVPSTRFSCAGNPPSPLLVKDERVLTDRPLYVGDRIAAVAALTSEACAEALAELKVTYEPLEAVFGVEEAMSERAPVVHPELFDTNVFKKLEARQGDVEEGFGVSDYIFEETYYAPTVQHVALEPVGCICDYAPEGKLAVWANTQTPFHDRRILAELLDLPESRIRIIKPAMGGGFGGRQQIHNQHVGAFLSRLVRKPVKIINNREEEMYASTARHECVCRLKAGVDKRGRFRAFHAKVYLNSGAYSTHGAIVAAAQSRKFHYRVPHYLYEGFCVYSNAPVAGAMRGYGNPQLTFAREVFIDKIAKTLDMDPLEFRMMNQLEVGETIPAQTFALRSCAVKECVEAGKEIISEIDEEEACGVEERDVSEAWGVAFACHTSGPSNNEGLSSCVILVNDDGSVNLLVGSADMGQGCETTLSQIVAEQLGTGFENVSVVAADTLHTPYDMGAYASSEIYVAGNAAYQAASDVREKLISALADRYSTDPEMIRYEGGKYKISTPEGRIITHSFGEAVSEVSFGMHGAVIMGRSSFKAQESPPPFAVCWAKVAVHKETKEIEVRHVIQAVDVGTAINPQVVIGQVEGGIGMGVGYALMERIEIDQRAGKPSSSDLLHYKIPTSLDMPKTHVRIVDSFEPTGPFGAKSVGELPVVPVAAAIANAVSNATGEEIKRLPLTEAYIPGGKKAGPSLRD